VRCGSNVHVAQPARNIAKIGNNIFFMFIIISFLRGKREELIGKR
jgi:hypothetical protein